MDIFLYVQLLRYFGTSARGSTTNSTTELGHRYSQSETGELVRWRMEREEGAGQERQVTAKETMAASGERTPV